MADYTKLIELKVKDTDLGRALKKLTTSLDRIERKLDKIGTKSFKGVTSSADRAAKSVQKLEKRTTNIASVFRRARLDIVTTGAGLWALNKATTAVDASLRGVTVGGLKPFAAAANATTGKLLALKAGVLGAAAAHPLLTAAVVAGTAAFTLFGSNTLNVGKKLVGLVQGVKKAGEAVRKFVSQVKAPSKTELTIFDRIQSAKGGGLVGLRNLLNQVTAAQAKLISTNRGYVASSEQVRAVEKALNAELMARKKIMDQIIIGEQRRTPTSSLTAAAGEAGGLEGLRTLLAEAQGIQDRMLTTNENYKVASARVRNIQKAINAELERRDKIMGKVNEKEQKSVSLGERLRGLAGNVGGRVAREARPGRALERRGLMVGTGAGLAGLGMVQNTGIGQFMGNVAVNPAMGGLKNAANLAMGAHIPGAGIAAKGVADTKMALVGLTAAAKTAAGVALLNPQAIGLLASAWLIFGNKGIRGAIEKLIGAERAAKKTTAGLFSFAKANPVLSKLNMKLELSKDVVKTLGSAVDETSKKLAGMGKNKGNILQNLRASRAGRSTSGFAQWEASLAGTGTASARDAMVKSLERKNKRLVQLGQEKLKGDRLINKEMKEQLKTATKLEKSADRQHNKAKQRLKNWKKIRTQKAENLMLGAGFPLLFGGGVGATAGGVTGSMVGNALGMGGFGTQIIGSAIGTMIDTAVQKVTALKQALNELNMDNLVESGIRLTGEMQAQIEILRQLGEHDKARAIAAEQVRRQTGLTQGTMGDINNAVNLLKVAWNDVSHSVGGVLGILSAPFIVALSGILKVVSLVAQGFNTLAGALGEVLRKIPGSEKLAKAFERLSKWLANSKKEAILLARAMNKIGDTAFTRASIRGQKHRGLNLTFDQQRANLGFDRDEMRMDFNAETRRLAAEIRKNNPDKDLQNMLIAELNKQRTAEFKLEDQAFKFKSENIDQLEAEALRKLETKQTMLKAQLQIEEKINAAKRDGDNDTVVRLGYESKKLSIQQQLGEDLRKAKSVEEEILLVKIAILKMDKDRLAVTDRLTDEQLKLKTAYEQIGNTIKSGIVDAIESAVEGTKTLGEVASQVLRQIAKQILTSGINNFFDSVGKKNKGSWLGALFGSFGNFGGGKAKGGPVTGGTSYLVGEKGPELFTPKSSGHITANDGLGGSVINVSVDASGSSAEGDADKGRELGRMLGAAIQAELLKQQRPGGILSR